MVSVRAIIVIIIAFSSSEQLITEQLMQECM